MTNIVARCSMHFITFPAHSIHGNGQVKGLLRKMKTQPERARGGFQSGDHPPWRAKEIGNVRTSRNNNLDRHHDEYSISFLV